MKDQETFSLVILTYNGLEHVKLLFPSIRRQSIQVELIVVDSSSTDGTCEYLESQGIQYTTIPKDEFDHGSTRNLGLSLAQGKYVVFLTQDVILDNDDSLELLIQPLIEQNDVVMSFGRQLPKPNASIISEFARLNNYPNYSFTKSKEDSKRLGIKTPWISNSYSAYKKDKLFELGGFPSNLIMCEDVYAGAKAILKGYKIAYVAEAKAFHSHNYTIIEEFKRYFDIGYFYNSESWILNNFSQAEAEGLSFVKKEISYLVMNKHLLILPEFFIRTIAKYLGYKFGKHANKFSDQIKSRLSMHSYYWKRKEQLN